MYKNHNKPYTKEEDKFILDNFNKLTYKEIGNILGRKDTSISDRIHKVLKVTKTKKELWSDEEVKLLMNMYSSHSNTELSVILNRSIESIAYKAMTLKLFKDKSLSFTYKINNNYFKNKTANMYYILGLIAADGNVFAKGHTTCTTITLHRNDTYLLELINKETGNERPVYESKNSMCDCFKTCSKTIAEDLISLGIIQNKSLKLKWLSNIPDEYLRDFIRGYIDGDGCITTYNRKRKYKTDIILEVSILGTDNFLSGMSYNINRLIGLPIINTCKTSSNIRKIKYSCKSALRLIQWLYYDDAELFLKRKKDVYINYISKMDSNSGN